MDAISQLQVPTTIPDMVQHLGKPATDIVGSWAAVYRQYKGNTIGAKVTHSRGNWASSPEGHVSGIMELGTP